MRTRLPWVRTLCAPVIGVVVVAVGLASVDIPVARAGPVIGVATLGDSVMDEYQFPIFFPPGGDRSRERNLVELLAEARGLNFGDFSQTARPSPRNQGYEYNWAEDGSTSDDLISKGQHTGAAGQANSALVNLAWIFIGGNDVRGLYTPDVIQGPDPAAAIQAAMVNLATNVNVAVQTLLAANTELDVVVANLPDLRSIPGLRQAIASTPGLEVFAGGVDQAVQGYNAQIQALADGSDRVAMVDAYAISKVPLPGTPIPFDGIVLDPIVPDNGATHYFVDVIHPGTVASGILANAFVDASNAEFGSGIQRFTERELVALAIPLPAPVLLGVAGLMMAARVVVRNRRAA